MSENFLFVSIDGLVGDIAWRVREEGNDVRYFIENETERDIADGFVEKVDEWEPHVDWADTVVFDDAFGHGERAARLREEGHRVVGGTPYTDRLEDDRTFAQEELAAAGVDVLSHAEFTDFDEAVEWVRENPDRYVIKPSGAVQNVKRLVYVGDEPDGSDVIRILRSYERSWGEKIRRFQLQRRADGVEVAVTGLFNGERFVEPFCVNFEHKRLFPGNVGPSTGEMGTSATWTGRTRLVEATLGAFESRLAEEGYVGAVDLNCIADADGVYPLEFTPRFGYPTVFLMEEAMTTPIARVLSDLARGADPEIEVGSSYQVGVRVCLPPFPFDDDATFEEFAANAPINFRSRPRAEWTDRHRAANAPPGVHLEDVKCVDGQWRVAGTSGVVLLVAGTGETMSEARAAAYDRVDDVLLPNMYYRDDVGERWVEGDGDRLLAWGYFGGVSPRRSDGTRG